jgi:hypothetical protein
MRTTYKRVQRREQIRNAAQNFRVKYLSVGQLGADCKASETQKVNVRMTSVVSLTHEKGQYPTFVSQMYATLCDHPAIVHPG